MSSGLPSAVSRSSRLARCSVAGVLVLGLGLGLISCGTSSADDDASSPTTPRPTGSATSSPLRDDLDAAARGVVDAGIPSYTARLDDGAETMSFAYGVADRESGQPVDLDAEVQIGSNTKMFVATVLLRLAEEGTLTLDDTVETWLPGVVPNGSAITIRMLLQHTSGIANYTASEESAQQLLIGLDEVRTPQQLVELAVSQPVSFAPGESWEYTNTGFILAGMIAEAATGTPANELIASYITEPLGLTHTYWDDEALFRDENHTSGYGIAAENGELTYRDISDTNLTWAGAAGALVSTLSDMEAFQKALLGGELLSAESMEQMQTTVSAGEDMAYGLGIMHVESPCGDAWGHGGGTFGFSTVMLATEDGERTFVSAAAGGDIDAEESEMVSDVFREEGVASQAFVCGMYGKSVDELD